MGGVRKETGKHFSQHSCENGYRLISAHASRPRELWRTLQPSRQDQIPVLSREAFIITGQLHTTQLPSRVSLSCAIDFLPISAPMFKLGFNQDPSPPQGQRWSVPALIRELPSIPVVLFASYHHCLAGFQLPFFMSTRLEPKPGYYFTCAQYVVVCGDTACLARTGTLTAIG